MPYIQIHISGQADTALAGSVAQQAIELTARLLGKQPALTAVAVDFVLSPHWFIAGKPLGSGTQRSYHWNVSITDETNTKSEKAVYIAAVHAAMGALLDGVAEHSYVHVADLRASAYGYGGLTQERRYQHPT